MKTFSYNLYFPTQLKTKFKVTSSCNQDFRTQGTKVPLNAASANPSFGLPIYNCLPPALDIIHHKIISPPPPPPKKSITMY